MSHDQRSDAGSARLSHIQNFKYNAPLNGMTNIRKVSPQAGNTQTMDYSSGGENKILPNI